MRWGMLVSQKIYIIQEIEKEQRISLQYGSILEQGKFLPYTIPVSAAFNSRI